MKIFYLFFIYFFICAYCLLAQEISFTAEDNPNDDGTGIILMWKIEEENVEKIIIERSSDGTNFIEIANPMISDEQYLDVQDIKPNIKYFYQLNLYNRNGEEIISPLQTTVFAKAQWFNSNRYPLFLMTVLLAFAIIYYIVSARKGKHLFIRRISGLETIEEAVGRATELGKPLLFVPGILDLDDMQTLAGLNILSHLAQKVAQYESTLYVPVCRSMVLSTAKEIVKESYLKAGRPDAFNPDSVFYLTDDQFGYVAGVDGIIMREKPAANFYLGAFYAESLILAETGFESGAIQIAGTAMPSQIPFFVAACDYTLIGEELFAASAYLSNEPAQLGSLKGQDVGKAIIIITFLAGIVLEMFGIHFLKEFFTMH
ncbi:MAG: hypothetical protein ISS28_00140 [Candidatus Cloacimonetes bacterium]|nr:hypothetical protein [Candidatus Cloacimonadota bacterium]